MALVVEDGSAKADAESYASVADADTYLVARGYTLWASEMSEAEKEQALRRATDYMEQSYGTRWAGYRKTDTQALAWPRYDVPRPDTDGAYVADDIVPAEVRNACCLLAFKAASGDLSPDLDQPVTEKTVGPITVRYQPGARQFKKFRSIDMMLGQMLRDGGGGSSVRLVRA